MEKVLLKSAGVDLSMNSTGLCLVVDGGIKEVATIKSAAKSVSSRYEHMLRVHDVVDRIMAWLIKVKPHVVVVEDYAYSRNWTKGSTRGAEFRGVFLSRYMGLFQTGDTFKMHFPIFISPITIKLFATGNRSADKQEIVWFVENKFDVESLNQDEADASILAFIGWCWAKKFGRGGWRAIQDLLPKQIEIINRVRQEEF